MSVLDLQKGSFKSGLKRIKAFLRQKWEEVLVFFAFLLLSFGIWMLQGLQQDYEIEIAIPVKYRNVPPGLYLSGMETETIKARIKDKGTVLMNYSFGHRFTPVEIDFRKLDIRSEEQGQVSIPGKDIEADIQKQLITSTALLGFTPNQIELSYSKRVHKEIPVLFDGTVIYEPGFQLSGEISVTPSSVTVYASKEILDTVSGIKTVYTEVKNVKKSFEKTVGLAGIEGLSFEPGQVKITVPVDEYIEKSLDVNVECVGIPDGYRVRLLPHTVKVNCNIPMGRFRDLTARLLAIRIPYPALENNLSGTQKIELSEKPEWVRNFSLSPGQIEFIIEQVKRND